MTAVVEGSATVVARSVAEVLGDGVQPGAVVVVLTADGPVSGRLVVDDSAVGADERRCAVVGLDGCSVLAAGPVSEVMVSGSPVPTEDAVPGWVSALAGAYWSAQQARVERDTARWALTAHEARLGRIVVAAHGYADQYDLCERFDDFMESQGLPPRSRDFVVEVDATVRVRVSMSARNGDAAAGKVDDYAIADAIQEMSRETLYHAIQDRDVVDTEEM